MVSSYSPSLRLELMATGDQSGTWGTTTNTNLGTLLEQAIAGVLSVAQGDVANLTLTATDGASDEARNMVVNITGAITAARNVVVPTAEKVYLAKNSTTGGFAVTFKTAAGTGVSVLPGTSQWVYCDGTNVVAGLVDLQTLSLTALSPTTTDGLALGTTSLMWGDLFLASGGVINWNNGDVTVTHSANTLAFAGASSGYTFDAAVTLTNTGLHLLDTDASHDLIIAPGSNLTADRTLTVTTGDAAHTLDISGAPINVVIASGVYTPTLTNTTNVAASTAYECPYMRVGDMVLVSGIVDIDVTAATTVTLMGMSVPIASNFATQSNAGGAAAAAGVALSAFAIEADVTNDRVSFRGVSGSGTANSGFSFSFTYRII
ncbi:MAG: hypothetical protein WC829_04555 [Hyphomicrobium sp.]|jgi:hypothetical protein